MPIYEYKCSECESVYEKRQKFSDPVDTVCQVCGKPAVSRLTSAPALVFKGSGWYINDYARNGKNGKSGSSMSSPGGESGSKTETSSKSSDSSSSSASESSKPAPAAKSE